jgi:hypothetical protein
VATPPEFQSALQPTWGDNRCLALAAGGTCPPGDSTPYSEDPDSDSFAEAAEVFETVNDLNDEQEAIARFWSDDPGGHGDSARSHDLDHDSGTAGRGGVAVDGG